MNMATMLQNLAEETLNAARKKGATDAAIYIGHTDGFSVETQHGALESIEHQADRGMQITVYQKQSKGSVSTSDFDRQSLENCIDKALNIARLTDTDPYLGLADIQEFATDFGDLDSYHPWDISPAQAIDLVLSYQQQIENLESRIQPSSSASLSTSTHHVILANSKGFSAYRARTQHMFQAQLIAQDKSGMESDSACILRTDPSELGDFQHIVQQAGDRALSKLGSRSLRSQKAPVIFSSRVSKNLIRAFLESIHGKRLYLKNTCFLNSLGKKIFPEFMHIGERPHVLKKLGSTRFDTDGVATRTQDFVKDGIVDRYLLGVYTARQLKMHSTGNADGAHNAYVSPTLDSLDDLLNSMDTGLFITSLVGSGLDLLTGNYSEGVEGFWVERGEIQYPVSEITVSGNFKTMLENIVAISNDPDPNYSTQVGSILFDNCLTISGQ